MFLLSCFMKIYRIIAFKEFQALVILVRTKFLFFECKHLSMKIILKLNDIIYMYILKKKEAPPPPFPCNTYSVIRDFATLFHTIRFMSNLETRKQRNCFSSSEEKRDSENNSFDKIDNVLIDD